MFYAVRYKGTKLGLSMNYEANTDEWCAASRELTQFSSSQDARDECVKFGIALDLVDIIPHPHQTPLKEKLKLRYVSPPRFR